MLENLFMQIVDMTKTASVVIAVVLAARLLLKKAPKWISYALWAVVLLRLLCPFSIEAPVSAVPRMETVSVEMVDSTLPRFEFETLADRQINQHVMDTTPPGEPYALVTRSFEPSQWLSFIWLAGIAVMLIYSVVSYIRLRRRLVGAVLLRDNIYLADRITSPFVMGIILPKIYLPSALSEREQEYIILHEQRHIRRLDHVMKVLAFAALCLHWFNPLVWLAFILAGKDMEMSCDESVIKTLGSEIRADYSASLLSLATGRRLIAGTPLAFGEGDTRGRIKNLAEWKKPVIWIVIIALLLCVVLAVCLLTDPVDKGDILRSVEREHDIVRPGLEAAYEMELGEEVKSGTVVAEIWTNGECRQSIPVTFTDADTELNIAMHLRKEGEKYSGVEIEVNPSPSAGSLITYFPIPEYYEYLGWSTTAYEEKDEVKVKPGEAEVIAAMAFDVGNGVRAMDCQSLTEEPGRLKEYDCIIIILAGFSAEEVPTQQVTLAEPEPPIEVLQLHHVIKLAEKGYELGWEDFEDFYYYETGSGLYIRVYEIDETFSLHIGGSSPQIDMEPMYIYLVANDLDTRIDIRDGGVEEFIAEHGGKPAKLSDEKIAELRELYPADTDKGYLGEPVDIKNTLEIADVLAVVTVTGEAFTNHDTVYLPVCVDRIIYGDGSISEGTDVDLRLGRDTLSYGKADVPEGLSYLCFIAYGYSTSRQCMAYVVDDGYIMPVVAEGPFAEYEGWSVEAFLSACGITGEADDALMLDDSCLGSMRSIRAEWITLISGGNNEDKEQWAKVMNAAADSVVERSESIKSHWNVDVYSDTEETFRFYAGPVENIVMMYYHWDKAAYGTYFFEDKALYELIRGSFTYEGIVDEESLAEYEGIIATRAEGIIREYNRLGEGRFTGYELTEFFKYDSFQHRNNIDFDIYRCNIAFIPEDPNEIAWAGGMWLDSELRVRDYDLYTYLVVRSVDGEMVDYNFMFYDTYTGAGTDEERQRAHNEILNAWGEE